MKIIVDTLGADRGAEIIVRGAQKALQEQSAYDLILAGDPEVLDAASLDASRVEVLPAFSSVTNDDDPREMVKGKRIHPCAFVWKGCGMTKRSAP